MDDKITVTKEVIFRLILNLSSFNEDEANFILDLQVFRL
jgi:hypothetical protein